jgi:hypothetical protein
MNINILNKLQTLIKKKKDYGKIYLSGLGDYCVCYV